jgi:hypothetical protein
MVGLALSAHDNAASERRRFANVELAVPQLAYVPDTGYAAQVESTLEVLTISNRDRRIVRQFDGKIEAPNWSRDGKEPDLQQRRENLAHSRRRRRAWADRHRPLRRQQQRPRPVARRAAAGDLRPDRAR